MTKLSLLKCQVQGLLKVTLMMFKLPTRRLTTQLINKQKVLISGKYFLFTVMFTISLHHVYVVKTVSRGLDEKKVDNLLGDDCHMCQSRKIEKQVV